MNDGVGFSGVDVALRRAAYFTLAWVFADLGNPTIQDHAAEAIHRFTRKS